MNKVDFTLVELFERAKRDKTWEKSKEVREELVNGLVFQLLNSIT
ncbi:MAG: hypothetical protein ACOWWR_08200 [Eubacteriales bacterium]